jgi:hypothetical protein
MTTTHTLLIVVPLRVDNAQPGRIEAHRPEGVGGLAVVAAGIEAAVKALVREHAPDVHVEGIGAHVMDGTPEVLTRALDAAAEALRVE